MCERYCACRTSPLINLQMRRSSASLRNCISNRMHPRYPESSKRWIPVASAYPTTSKPCMLSINSPELTKPETTHNHIHRTTPDHLRHTNLAQMESAAAPRSNSADLKCDIGSSSSSTLTTSNLPFRVSNAHQAAAVAAHRRLLYHASRRRRSAVLSGLVTVLLLCVV